MAVKWLWKHLPSAKEFFLPLHKTLLCYVICYRSHPAYWNTFLSHVKEWWQALKFDSRPAILTWHSIDLCAKSQIWNSLMANPLTHFASGNVKIGHQVSCKRINSSCNSVRPVRAKQKRHVKPFFFLDSVAIQIWFPASRDNYVKTLWS